MAPASTMTGLPPVRMRHPSPGTLKFKGQAPHALLSTLTYVTYKVTLKMDDKNVLP